MLFPFDLGEVLTKLEYASNLNWWTLLLTFTQEVHQLKQWDHNLKLLAHFKVPHILIHILKIAKFSFLFPYLILGEIFTKDTCVCELGLIIPFEEE
jgi:hypothetical protein